MSFYQALDILDRRMLLFGKKPCFGLECVYMPVFSLDVTFILYSCYAT